MNDTIKGVDVLESSLAKVPSAASADTATNATHATSADNATTVGGIGAGVFGTTARYAGVDFKPVNSTTTYSYGTAGSMYWTGGGATFDARLSLPQGAKVAKLTIFSDNVAAGASGTLYLVRYDLLGAFQNVKDVAGGAAAGRSSVSADIAPAEVIDNTKYAYELAWVSPGNANRLAGAQVDYTLPSTTCGGRERGCAPARPEAARSRSGGGQSGHERDRLSLAETALPCARNGPRLPFDAVYTPCEATLSPGDGCSQEGAS